MTVAGFLLGALWGARNSIFPLAAGAAHGKEWQETVIMVVMYTGAPTGIAAFALMLWGLRLTTKA